MRGALLSVLFCALPICRCSYIGGAERGECSPVQKYGSIEALQRMGRGRPLSSSFLPSSLPIFLMLRGSSALLYELYENFLQVFEVFEGFKLFEEEHSGGLSYCALFQQFGDL